MSRSEAEECLLEDATPSAAGEDGYSSDFRYIRRMAREEARQVRRRVKRIMLGDRLHQFILSSQAVPVAVGVVFGSCLKNNVDAFVTAFIAPSIAAIEGLVSNGESSKDAGAPGDERDPRGLVHAR